MEKTIAAIATAISPAGLSAIRISGPEAFAIADKVFQSKSNKKLSTQKTHTIHYGFICDNGEVIDEVIALLMRAPHSFTTEDTVEFDCHGGILVTNRVLEAIIRAGANVADPGEFTKRAFLNGRIDLTKAEAVIELIEAKNDFAMKNSISHLKGHVALKVKQMRDELLDGIAFIEAALDDPEHIEIDGYSKELLVIVEKIHKELQHLIRKSNDGKVITEGIKTIIVGKPNAGKSSLLNQLVGKDRAIVTSIAGTTRDTLEEEIRIGGVNFQLIDTAGIRDTQDIIEQMGVNKAKEMLVEADLILYVVDASIPLDKDDEEIIQLIENKKSLVLLNKTDLEMQVTKEAMKERLSEATIMPISAKNRMGIDEMSDYIVNMFVKNEINFNDEVYITNTRQIEALVACEKSLFAVMESIHLNMPEDFFTIDMMNAYTQLGLIVGESLEEDLVNRIFEKFCMGK